MNPTAKWRKKHHLAGDGAAADDDDSPLDSQEQEEMVLFFEKELARQSRMWRRVFAGFLLGYMAFLVYSIHQQAWYPWELRYHAYFMEEMHSWMVITADLVAVLACLLAVKGLNSSKSPKQWMWYSCYTGFISALVWLFYMLRLPKFRWDVVWLPLAPLSGAATCLYLNNLLEESSEDVKKLRSYMYNYKAL